MSNPRAADVPDSSPMSSPPMTGGELRMGLETGLEWLAANREAIDNLNVFPVPDGDTGANMVLTLKAAVEETAGNELGSVSEVAHQAARGSLLGARGNSGVILSQIIGGMAKSLEGLDECSPMQFASSLVIGSQAAYDAVSKPVEGTILTVFRHAAAAAMQDASAGGSFESVLARATEAAERSVRDTPNRLAILKEAGVVDAGGQGVFIILDGFLKYVRGEKVEADVKSEPLGEMFEAFALEHSGDEHGFCTQFLIQGEDLNLAVVRKDLEATTDWAVIVGDDKLIRVHVHTGCPGDVLNYGIDLGNVDRISIENMDLQQTAHFASAVRSSTTSSSSTNLVAVATGTGFRDIYSSLGVIVVPGGKTMNPSSAQILEAIEACPRDEVTVLPNSFNVIMAAEQAATESTKEVDVLHTVTVPHGVVAALAYNDTRDVSGNRLNMTSAIAMMTVIEIARAVKDSSVGGLNVQKDDFIGLVDGKLQTRSDTIGGLISSLMPQIKDQYVELATIYKGAGVTETDESPVVEAIEANYPDVEIEIVGGGQAYYDYIISFE